MRNALLILAIAVAGCAVPYKGGARPVSASESYTGYVRAAHTPVVAQRDRTDCGLAALAMVAGAWGEKWSLEELSRAAKKTDRGVALGTIRDLARERGLDARAIKGTREDLLYELKQGRPVMLGLVLPFEGNNFLGHYEVAVAIDPQRGDVITLDPASGKSMRRAPKVLEAEWAAAKHATLVVIGKRVGTADARNTTGGKP